MGSAQWGRLGTPGDGTLLDARAGAAVLTGGGELWVRSDRAASGPWNRRGRPPEPSFWAWEMAVLEDETVADPMVVVADSGPTLWISRVHRGKPVWDPVPVHMTTESRSGLSALTVPGTGGAAPLRLFATLFDGTPWLGAVTGVLDLTGGPTTSFARLDGLPSGVYCTSVALAAASPAPGRGPVPQVVLTGWASEADTSRILVGVFGPDGWTWSDPGLPPDGAIPGDLRSAVSVPDGLGGADLCVLFDPNGALGVHVLQGRAGFWTWTDLGSPPEAADPPIGPRTVARGVAAVGTAPARACVVAAASDDRYYRSTGDAAAPWVEMTGLPPSRYVFPTGVLPADGDVPGLVGAGDGDVWSLPAGATASVRLPLALPVAGIVGGIPDRSSPAHRTVVLDERGGAWTWDQYRFTDQGRPSPTVGCRSPIGTCVWYPTGSDAAGSAFVVGTDEHVWELRDLPFLTAQWIDHGPAGTGSIRHTVAPVARTGGAPQAVDLAVLGGNGHLWTCAPAAAGWDPKNPNRPGTTVWTEWDLAGNQPLGSVAGAVATDAGPTYGLILQNRQVQVRSAGATAWTTLPDPMPGRRVGGRLGAVVADWGGGPETRFAFLDSSTARTVWTVTWPGEVWENLGTPAGTRVRDAGGMMPAPLGALGAWLFVVADDGTLWLHSGVGAAAGWASWGRCSPDVAVSAAVTHAESGEFGAAGPFLAALGDGALWVPAPPTPDPG